MLKMLTANIYLSRKPFSAYVPQNISHTEYIPECWLFWLHCVKIIKMEQIHILCHQRKPLAENMDVPFWLLWDFIFEAVFHPQVMVLTMSSSFAEPPLQRLHDIRAPNTKGAPVAHR